MKKVKYIVLALSLLSFQTYAYVDCTGEVSNLSLQMDNAGTVTLSLQGGPSYTYFCQINSSYNGVSAEVCKAMYSTLMAAKLTKKKVLIRFESHESCSDVPAWGAAGNLGWTQVLLD